MSNRILAKQIRIGEEKITNFTFFLQIIQVVELSENPLRRSKRIFTHDCVLPSLHQLRHDSAESWAFVMRARSCARTCPSCAWPKSVSLVFECDGTLWCIETSRNGGVHLKNESL